MSLERWFLLGRTLAIIGLCAAAGYAFVEIGNKARTETVSQIDGQKVNAEITELHKTNLLLNDPQNGLPAILADAHRTELIAAGAISNIEKGTRTWQKKQNSLADQSQIVLTDTQNELLSLTKTTDSLSQSIQEQNSNLSRLQSTASDSLSKMGTLSDSLDSAVTAISSNAERVSKNAVGITDDLHTETGILVAQTKKAVAPKNKALSLLEATGGGSVTLLEIIYYLHEMGSL